MVTKFGLAIIVGCSLFCSGCFTAGKMTLGGLADDTKDANATSVKSVPSNKIMMVQNPSQGGSHTMTASNGGTFQMGRTRVGGDFDSHPALVNSSGTTFKMRGGFNATLY